MFVGHLGVGLALKKADPRLSLGVLFLAVLLLDLLLGVFVLVGLEQVHVPADYARLRYLTFTFPYSHGLLASAGWSLLAAAVAWLAWRRPGGRRTAALVVAAAVFSHFVCDWIEHVPELPVAGVDSAKLGLGLWNYLGVALALEAALVVVGLLLYLSSARDVGRLGSWGVAVLMLLLTPLAIFGQATAAAPPQPAPLAVGWIAQAVLLAGLAFWLDRPRVG